MIIVGGIVQTGSCLYPFLEAPANPQFQQHVTQTLYQATWGPSASPPTIPQTQTISHFFLKQAMIFKISVSLFFLIFAQNKLISLLQLVTYCLPYKTHLFC